ncbi:OLC1v1025798C1 [Oldenlandia corymbosa var. corymbosa]|uniref:OLC1v1025798C1 n=1 Tax=Oldenlandia corymbosa var. corymbosa TaxID=529605 RepID=A0AAV1C5Q0_OLDCO|nr:OLC1v1025798C1 [Oldenlandia corymbosa var. corymbosa]
MSLVELKELQKLEGHTDRAWCVCWEAGHRRRGVPAILASCGGDKAVRIWEQNPATGSFECKVVLDETHTKTDIVHGLPQEKCSQLPVLMGHGNEVKSVAWNANSTLLVTWARDKTVMLWEIMPDYDYDCLGMQESKHGHVHDVKMVEFHPNLDILFSCSYDNSIKVWAEVDDVWDCVQTLDEANNNEHISTVWALSFNATGDRMVSCSDDLTLKIWGGDGFGPWRHIRTLSGSHDRTIFTVDWSRRDGIDRVCN